MPDSKGRQIVSEQFRKAEKAQTLRMLIYLAIVVLLLAVLAADFMTTLGIAVWLFYLFPITLSLFLRNPLLPLALAATCTAFVLATLATLATLVSDTPGISLHIAQTNRGFGIFTFWILGAVGYFYVSNNNIVRRQMWIQSGKSGLSELIGGDLRPEDFGNNVLSFIVEFMGANVGVLFVGDGKDFQRTATYGVPSTANVIQSANASEGLLGSAITGGSILKIENVPDGYLLMGSALGQTKPARLLIAPLKVDGEVNGIIEVGFLDTITEDETEFLDSIAETVGVAIASSRYRSNLQRLLAETRQQAEELQQQGEELRVSNEELEAQSRVLQESHAQLEQQQAELEQTNVQLEEQTQLLLAQRDELAKATLATQAKATELEIASRYKSDFLANMSHELRTPLNSALILSKLLAENSEGNLTVDQIESAQTIHSAGNDLLNLINDILDLSKIEAGKMTIRPEWISLQRLTVEFTKVMRPIATDKGLDFRCLIHAGVPGKILTDQQRLQQILKNLMSNAIKFTDKGHVEISVSTISDRKIAIEVSDTGIGIASEKQADVFKAFEQVDSAANRRFSGTGLGLTITTELVRILGGEISLTSEIGQGSTFRVILPVEFDSIAMLPTSTPGTDAGNGNENHSKNDRKLFSVSTARGPSSSTHSHASQSTFDSALETAHEIQKQSIDAQTATSQVSMPAGDSKMVRGNRCVILIVEDDEVFATIIAKVAREMDFDCLIASTAHRALATAVQSLPDAIILDIGLPDETGLVVLDRLKQDARTRHIPVHIISANDFTETALAMGAYGYVVKPVTHEMLTETLQSLQMQIKHHTRCVLIVEDNPVQLRSLHKLLASRDVKTVGVTNVSECLELLKSNTFDCMVLDLTLPDSSGYELLKTLSDNDEYSFPPVIIYTGHELSADQEQLLRRYSTSIIIKGAKSPERLLDEVTLFLHQMVGNLPEEQQKMIRKARSREAALEGRRILVVEDDARNIFALTSILEPRGAVIEIARNGKEAISVLSASLESSEKAIHLVLMDVMMPEMDGLTATRQIRKRPEFATLPIVMLTAKAMKDDQAECIDAGANDYMAKPLDVDKLLSLVRVWIRK